ncbi:MAG: hypothetical protein KAS23_15705, partial [Anaerohalosphaera sp.]|nr:hypothetical protein [Anaerohalosphaera sp.]
MYKTLSLIILAMLFLFCSSTTYACNNAPVAHMILPTIDPAHVAGKTIIYDSFGTDIDGDAIVAYLWTFPDEAYCVTGENTSSPQCKYSPESSEYTCTLSLKVKDSTGLWSVLEEVNITVAPLASAATWYVSTEGDNLNDGRSEIPEIDNW